jgi:hypothetical protein
MGAMLDALLALQDIELQIVDIRRQLASRQRTVRQQTRNCGRPKKPGDGAEEVSAAGPDGWVDLN